MKDEMLEFENCMHFFWNLVYFLSIVFIIFGRYKIQWLRLYIDNQRHEEINAQVLEPQLLPLQGDQRYIKVPEEGETRDCRNLDV